MNKDASPPTGDPTSIGENGPITATTEDVQTITSGATDLGDKSTSGQTAS